MQIENVKSSCASGEQTKNESSDESIQTSTARNYTCSAGQLRACRTGFVTYTSNIIKTHLGQIHITPSIRKKHFTIKTEELFSP